MKPARLALPAWLARLLQDTSAGPRLYRWTVEDVGGGDGGRGRRARLGGASAADDDAARRRRRIYVLGVGNLGRLFAASLARLEDDPPPITLVVHRLGLLEQWRANPGLVLHPPPGGGQEGEVRIVDVDVEMWSEDPPPGGGGGGGVDVDRVAAEIGPIANLIVATKAQDALPTVDRLRRYLGAGSAVAFAQNGMSKLWPPCGAVYDAARFPAGAGAGPLWLPCVVTHGVFSQGPFESVHASPGGVVLGAVGAADARALEASGGRDCYLARQLLASARLGARLVPRAELWALQLEKLVVNAVINPLTALLRCKNGDLFCDGGDGGDPRLARIMDRLLAEASAVLQALARGADGAETGLGSAALVERLSFARLRAMLHRVGAVVQDNTSSMLQDVRAGKPTEIAELSGWFVETAQYLASLDAADGTQLDSQQLGVASHQLLMDLVEAGQPLSRDALCRCFGV